MFRKLFRVFPYNLNDNNVKNRRFQVYTRRTVNSRNFESFNCNLKIIYNGNLQPIVI